MTSRIVLLVGMIVSVVLSFAGCLDAPQEMSSVDDQEETTTLDNARITQDGAALLIQGTSNGVAASVRSSSVTFEQSPVGDSPSIIELNCHKCVCTESGVCICRPIDCPPG